MRDLIVNCAVNSVTRDASSRVYFVRREREKRERKEREEKRSYILESFKVLLDAFSNRLLRAARDIELHYKR